MSKVDMGIDEVLKRLPQRPPFLFIDKVIDVVPGESLVAIKNVTINEPFFVGHFPQQPIMPGVLILEALAQASTVLAFLSMDECEEDGVMYFFAGIDKARFKRVVVPGDQLRLEVSFINVKHRIWKLKTTAKVDNEIVCTAQLMSARKEEKKQ